MTFGRILTLLALGALAACGGGEDKHAQAPATTAPAAAPAPPPTTPPAPLRDALTGGPYPALLVTQAHFLETTGPDGKPQPLPGPARLVILRDTGAGGWQKVILDDPDSNVFHKALQWDGGVLTIGGNKALLRTWRFADGKWTAETHWNPVFGGKQNRLRDVERGDVDGDGKPEIFATPSQPNKLDQEQPGEVIMFRRDGDKWVKSVVDAPGDTHAKEILTADMDGDKVDELYVVWEGAVAKGGALVRPVTIKAYRWKDGKVESSVVASVPDRQMRSIAAGDVNGDGKTDLVAGALATGIYVFEQQPGGTWKPTVIEKSSSGYEHPVYLADLDGNGVSEIYVASEDQGELRRYRFENGAYVKTVLMPLSASDITWNITAGKL